MILRKILFVAILACFLIAKTSASGNNTRTFSPQILKAIKNYKGCKIWEENTCIQCAHRYYFNDEGICTEVDPQCRMFNGDMKMCENCYEGYVYVDGNCHLRNDSAPQNNGCRTWVNNVCEECSFRFYFNSEKVCTQVNDLCRTWSDENGDCLSCYGGYKLDVGSCLPTNVGGNASQNILCAVFEEGACVECAFRAYFDENGICLEVNPQCRTFDNLDGTCLSCYDGYEVNNGQCILSQNGTGVSDPGCRKFENNTCAECSFRFYFDQNRVCQAVDDLCQTWSDENGDCLSCYKGYSLSEGSCNVNGSSGSGNSSNNNLCAEFDDTGVCVKCAFRAYFDDNGNCLQVNPQCKTWKEEDGSCLTCYDGFNQENGDCILADSNGTSGSGSDPGCRAFQNNTCVECSFRFYFDVNGVCQAVNDLCQTWSEENGDCLTCYKGYTLNEGSCSVNGNGSSGNGTGSNDLCAQFDETGACVKCAFRAYFGENGICLEVNPQCKTWNDVDGQCLTCYDGYDLKQGQCLYSISNVQAPASIGCLAFDFQSQECVNCSEGWQNTDGKCVATSDFCAQSSGNNSCSKCIQGYELKDGMCMWAPVGGLDPGCRKFENNSCVQCSFRFYFDDNKKCMQVNDLCRTWNDKTGECESCYGGYVLNSGNCFVDEEEFDPGCHQWNWDNFTCEKCSFRFVMKEDRCTQVSDQCADWDEEGLCTKCYGGYILKSGQCVLGNPRCRKQEETGGCLSCFGGYILDAGECLSLAQLSQAGFGG